MATSVKEELLASREDFRRLAEEHMQYAQRLEALSQTRFPTKEEQLEEVQLKKLKLHIKDQMLRLQSKNQRQQVSA